MANYTTDTYAMKREILTFSNNLTKGLHIPKRKFIADMSYGMLASNSCLLSDIADTLHEEAKKKNTIERLSLNLAKGIPARLVSNYLARAKSLASSDPVVHIDDTDIVKPDGRRFEGIGIVRDGSESSSEKSVFKKGYHVTEACAMTQDGHPVSIFSKIHSSHEKGYSSSNSITFQAIERSVQLFKKATFVMDRGYDDNKMISKLEGLGQDYVIRLTKRRKLFLRNRWVSATELCGRRKGKIKEKVFYDGKNHDAYLSHVKVQVTASRKDVNLILVYGISESPMILLTSREIKSKKDVLGIARLYFSRWRIEEYFRAKKQIFRFEGFRVRGMSAIRSLNFLITLCMTFLAHMSMKKNDNSLKVKIQHTAAPLKQKVRFHYYRIAKGISGILSYAREGVRLWFKTRRPKYRQLSFRFIS